jgi:hypothetical protein
MHIELKPLGEAFAPLPPPILCQPWKHRQKKESNMKKCNRSGSEFNISRKMRKLRVGTLTLLTLAAAAMLVFIARAAIVQHSPLKPGLAHPVRLAKRTALQPGDKLAAAQSGAGHTYGAFWQVGGGYSSVVYLRNKDPQNPVNANVVLFSNDGSTLQQTPLKVAPGSVASLPLGSIVTPPNDSSASGGLMVEFPDGSRARAAGR